jgi:hypothetical protein
MDYQSGGNDDIHKRESSFKVGPINIISIYDQDY